MKCRQCGSELLPGQKKYCSGACCSMAYYIRKNPDRKPQAERWKAEHEQSINKNKRICKQCGKEFIMVRHSKGLFCSYRCRGKYRSEQPRKPKQKPVKYCKICGVEIVRGVYCGDECRKEKARRESRKHNEIKMLNKTTKERLCKECGNPFKSEYGSKRRVFCSDICLHRNMHRIRRHKERAKLRLVKVETVDPIKVFRRDGWICQICKRKLQNKDRGTYKDTAPELDHIIPLSKGGEHSYRNTQCSCRKCNADKKGNVRGQIRLFG